MKKYPLSRALMSEILSGSFHPATLKWESKKFKIEVFRRYLKEND